MRLLRFGNYTLPLFSRRDQIGTGDTGGALLTQVNSSGYDATGSGQATEAINTVTCSFEIVATTVASVQTQRDAIRALAGKRERLFAAIPGTLATERWVWARLSRVRMERRYEYIYYQPVELVFELAQPGWNGAKHGKAWELDDGWYLDSGLLLDSGDTPSALDAPGGLDTFNNGGNRVQTNAIVSIDNGSQAMTGFRLICGACDWSFSGTIAPYTSLIVDCGAKSVKNNNADAYGSFVLNSGHRVADWLRLEPGDNTVTTSYLGGAASMDVSYYDGWM